ncbi:hypothetical protein Nepgr_003992 [Nepenthes gracilis]|uniref:Uncharacterized protein n=1 Tax=Nepenthes gracilis TaxID=150966 RepID=A0AAD3S0I2_NEPGR|nr:hypothetical protein Nepgr_003992 [Nepenthes gracilis]
MDEDQNPPMDSPSCCYDASIVAIAKVDVPFNTVKVGDDPYPMEMSQQSLNSADRSNDPQLQSGVADTPTIFHDPCIVVASFEAEHSSQEGLFCQVTYQKKKTSILPSRGYW